MPANERPMYWGDKRYNNLNTFLKSKFGSKVFKISLDGGFSCPNRDGKLSSGGCAFCSTRGSGDFTQGSQLSIAEQYQRELKIMKRKWAANKYIAYFQAFSNTYAPVERLRLLYYEALRQPDIVGLAIATRPDCLPGEVLDLLSEINAKTYLSVEMGLQTIHSSTAKAMNLQYNYDTFLRSMAALQERKIEVVGHIILGLPRESYADMMATGIIVGKLPLQGLKIHLLHLLQGTLLEKMYRHQPFPFLSYEEYIKITVDILEKISPDIVIHRLTGDGPKDILIGPHWSRDKLRVLSGIDKELKRRDSWQGKYFQI